MQHQEIIEWLWSIQGGDYAFIAVRQEGRWKDYPFAPATEDLTIFDGELSDIFWTPLTFVEPQRSNETAAPSRVLFADLDPVDPRTLSIRPTMAWETSPGSYQALWLVQEDMGYSRFANLNRRITMLTGADPGGWMGSKVLRWPGSTNHKYDPPRPGRLLWWDPEQAYSVSAMEEMLPAIPNKQTVGAGEYPDPIPQEAYNDYVAHRWEGLTLSGRSMLMRKRVPDRSLHIVKTIRELLKTGVSTNTVFQLIWWAPYNKWRTDRYRPDQLWAEIMRAKFEIVD